MKLESILIDKSMPSRFIANTNQKKKEIVILRLKNLENAL
jgi:hypothetical protein